MENRIVNMKAYQVLHETIGTYVPAVAEEVGLTASVVAKWKLDPEANHKGEKIGARNPLDRLEKIMRIVNNKGGQKAFFPLYWLCQQFGFEIRPKEPCLVDPKAFLRAILEWNKGFGETAVTLEKVTSDGEITPAEREEICRVVMRQIDSLLSITRFEGKIEGLGHKKSRV